MAGKNKASKKPKSMPSKAPKPSQVPASPAAESKPPEPRNIPQKTDDNKQADIINPLQRSKILHVPCNDAKAFPKVLPVTVDTLGRMPPGEAALNINGNTYQHVCVFGVVCLSDMDCLGYIRYYLYDPYVDADTYVNVQVYPYVKHPTWYPAEAYISVSGFLCGVGEPKPSSTILFAYDVRSLTEKQYHEYLFQARVTKMRISFGKLPKTITPQKDLYNAPGKEFLMNRFAYFSDAKRLGAAVRCALAEIKDAPGSVQFRETDENKNSKVRRIQSTKGDSTAATTSNGTPSEASKSAVAAKVSVPPNFKTFDEFFDSLKLPFSFYDNHVPLSVTMLAKNPTKNKFVWLGLPFKNVRTIGVIRDNQVVKDKKLSSLTFQYCVESPYAKTTYTVIHSFNAQQKNNMFFHEKGAFVEIYGTLCPSTPTNQGAALYAQTIKKVDPQSDTTLEFFKDVQWVRDDVDECTQALIVAKSYTDYRSRHDEPTTTIVYEWSRRLLKTFQFGKNEKAGKEVEKKKVKKDKQD